MILVKSKALEDSPALIWQKEASPRSKKCEKCVSFWGGSIVTYSRYKGVHSNGGLTRGTLISQDGETFISQCGRGYRQAHGFVLSSNILWMWLASLCQVCAEWMFTKRIFEKGNLMSYKLKWIRWNKLLIVFSNCCVVRFFVHNFCRSQRWACGMGEMHVQCNWKHPYTLDM